MKQIKDTKEIKLNFEPKVNLVDQREQDRRKEPCEGFTYISMVGWICRREKTRRKDDPFDFC